MKKKKKKKEIRIYAKMKRKGVPDLKSCRTESATQ
jgi:hypothetical protein